MVMAGGQRSANQNAADKATTNAHHQANASMMQALARLMPMLQGMQGPNTGAQPQSFGGGVTTGGANPLQAALGAQGGQGQPISGAGQMGGTQPQGAGFGGGPQPRPMPQPGAGFGGGPAPRPLQEMLANLGAGGIRLPQPLMVGFGSGGGMGSPGGGQEVRRAVR